MTTRRQTTAPTMEPGSGGCRAPEVESILVVNAWHDDNRGDSAICLGTLQLLRQRWPSARIKVRGLLAADHPDFPSAFRHVAGEFADVECGPSLAPTLGPERGFRRLFRTARWISGHARRFASLVLHRVPAPTRRALEGVDLVVAQGGSNLFDSGSRLGGVRLFQLLYPLWAAQVLGIPTALLGHTLGPFRGRSGRWLAGRVLRATQTVVVREARSLETARALGMAPGSVRLAPDLAFSVEAAVTPRVTALMVRAGLRPGRFAVLAVRTHPYLDVGATQRIVGELARVVDHVVAEGYVDRVAVVAHTLGPTSVEDDRTASRELMGRLAPGTSAVLVEDDLSPGEATWLYGRARFVVGVRLHAVILALAGGTPAYAISYFTDKAPGIMEQLGMTRFLSDFEGFTAAEFAGVLPELVQSATRQQLASVIPAVRGQLADAVRAL